MATEKMTVEEIESTLAGFSGTDNWHKYSFGLTITDGVKFLADSCGAYWFLDVIASYQPSIQRSRHEMLKEFQIWTLRHKPTKTYPCQAIAECFADSGLPAALTQKIRYTDFPKIKANDESFPDAAIKLYVENGVICLPSER